MPAFRTALVTLVAGGAAVATGVVVTTNASATPAPRSAVSAVSADDTASTPDAAEPTPARQWWKNLDDTRKTCLTGAKVSRPVGPLDDAERAALRAKVETAAKTCGVELPRARARAFWAGLSDTQRSCLKDAAVNRPWGPATKEQRQKVRADLAAAAKTCGVTLPAKPAEAPTTT